MKAKIVSYDSQSGHGTVVAENNKTYNFSSNLWHEQRLPNIGEEVEIETDIVGNISKISYGILHKNYASTVPKSEPLIQNEGTSEWQIEENYNFFDWFKKCIRNYVNFRGRARRKEYWYFYLMAYIIYIVAISIDSVIGSDSIIFIGLAILVLFLPSLAVTIRRLHDVNKSGWYYLLTVIPLIGAILLLVWTCTDTYPDTNKWGKPARRI